MRPGSLVWISLAACGRIGFDSGAAPIDAGPDAMPVADCTVLADGTPCDDRNICTVDSSCSAGVCKPVVEENVCTVARSDTEFATMQGVDGWFYGFWDSAPGVPYDPDTDFALGVYNAAGPVYEPMAPTGNFIYLAPWGTHPQLDPTTTIPVRRWVSDVSGPAIATYGVRKADINCGDGIEARLLVDGTIKSMKTIAFDDGSGATIGIPVDLAVGTRVELQIAPGDSEACDTTETELKITSPTE